MAVANCEALALAPTFAGKRRFILRIPLDRRRTSVFENPLMKVIVGHVERDESVHKRGMR
jgi:hypothetical protein